MAKVDKLIGTRIFHYDFKCNDSYDDEFVEKLQDITKFDTLADGEYVGVPDRFLNKVLFPLDFNTVKKHISKSSLLPKLKNIEYCMYNSDYDVIFIYDSENDIHYFYRP